MGWTIRFRLPKVSGIFTFTTTSGSVYGADSASYLMCPETLFSGINRLECDAENILQSNPRIITTLHLFPHAACCRVND
jgi:hypothetical protein